VISGDGTVAFRHAGPLTRDVVETNILPLIRGGAASAQAGERAGADEPSG